MPTQRNECLTLSVEDTARLLGISRGLAYQMVREKQLPSLRFGRRIVVPRYALERLLEGRDGGMEDGGRGT